MHEVLEIAVICAAALAVIMITGWCFGEILYDTAFEDRIYKRHGD